MLADWNEIDRLQRDNAALRAALELLTIWVVAQHGYDAADHQFCDDCRLILRARQTLAATPPASGAAGA